MEIDTFHRRLIFASHNQFMMSDMSEPNSTTILYTTDQQIRRFIYGMGIFTSINERNRNRQFSLIKINLDFRNCLIRLLSVIVFTVNEEF